jgi:hypothetical protein
MKKQMVGCIRLKGIHNDFLTRDILDYKLEINYNLKKLIISSGVMKCNSSIYTDFKFSNEIREKGGETFLFPIIKTNSNSELFRMDLYDNKNEDYLCEVLFNPDKLNYFEQFMTFLVDDEKQKFKFEYEKFETEIMNFRLNFFKISSPSMKEEDLFRLFLWFESDLGKQSLIDLKHEVNSLSKFKKNCTLIKGNDLCLKGEVFDNKNNSMIQISKKITPENIHIKNEIFEKNEFKLHLDYSLII